MVKFDWWKIYVSTDAPSGQVHLLLEQVGMSRKIWL
jgi:hypothetical protein